GILLTVNAEAPRLEGFGGKAAAAALPLAPHHSALLAGGDAVPVALKHFLGYPADDGCRVLAALELLHQLLFEFVDVAHVRFLGLIMRPLCVTAPVSRPALSEWPSEVTG